MTAACASLEAASVATQGACAHSQLPTTTIRSQAAAEGIMAQLRAAMVRWRGAMYRRVCQAVESHGAVTCTAGGN